jgi:hypothetical protein
MESKEPYRNLDALVEATRAALQIANPLRIGAHISNSRARRSAAKHKRASGRAAEVSRRSDHASRRSDGDDSGRGKTSERLAPVTAAAVGRALQHLNPFASKRPSLAVEPAS